MRWLAFFCLPLFPALAWSGPDDDAAALLRLAAEKQRAKNAQAVEPPVALTALSYAEASAKAVKDGKPLAVWVGCHCTLTIAQTSPDVVHVHVDTFDGSKAPRVVCSVPDGRGWLTRSGEVATADVCAANLRGKLGLTKSATPGASPRRTDCGCTSTRNCRCPASGCDCPACFPTSRFRSEAAPVTVPPSLSSLRTVRVSGC